MIHTVISEESGMRLDVFVHDRLLIDYSREYIIKLIKGGKVTVDGSTVKAGFRISEGNRIQIEKTDPPTPNAAPNNIPIDVIYEDDDVIVINKPRGMTVHPGSGNPDNTLVNALMYHTGGKLSSEGENIRPGIVHRIDKDTSGLLVAAKSNRAHDFLARQFKNHCITREYLAICEGSLQFDKIKIDKPIARSKKDRKKMDIDMEGRNAVTHISVIERLNNATYASVRLETGRTHQIRVHMKSIGHPLIGDLKYGKKHSHISGQALHAARLGFLHPKDERYVEFYEKPPKDFEDLVAFLKII